MREAMGHGPVREKQKNSRTARRPLLWLHRSQWKTGNVKLAGNGRGDPIQLFSPDLV